MTDTPTTGGTVRYHRADWVGDVDRNFPWRVLFTPDDGPVAFTREQGEAMGLTPPPAPLVVTCKGHSIELSDEEAAQFAEYWVKYGNRTYPYSRAATTLGELLRDARQDPQPASDTPSDVVSNVQSVLDTSDGIDFDALPIGTEMEYVNGDVAVRRHQGWWNVTLACWCDPTTPDDWRVVYQPAPLSPGECLRGLLAGRTDADQQALLAHAEGMWASGAGLGWEWAGIIGDAAREVHG